MGEQSQVPTAVADKLVDTRNMIVHDKPFRLVDYGVGDVDIDYFRLRQSGEDVVFRYEDLKPFFDNCDLIDEFIKGSLEYNVFGNGRINFARLLA